MNGTMRIPYNPATDPKQYAIQGFQNMLSGILEQQAKKQRTADLQDIGNWAKGGFVGQSPQLRTDFGQQLAGKLLDPLAGLRAENLRARTEAIRQPKPISPTQQISQKKLDKINRLQAKVDAGTATKKDQAMLDKMLAGVSPVQITFGKPAAAAERTAIAETRASIDALNNLKELFDNAQTKTGPVTGRISPIAGLVGMTTGEQEAFMAATSAFKNKIIKENTGAQMSEVEAERIMKQIPDITDPPTRWKAKWEQSKKNLEFLQKRRLEILRQSGLRVPIDINLPETQINIPEDIMGMSDEELKRIAGME